MPTNIESVPWYFLNFYFTCFYYQFHFHFFKNWQIYSCQQFSYLTVIKNESYFRQYINYIIFTLIMKKRRNVLFSNHAIHGKGLTSSPRRFKILRFKLTVNGGTPHSTSTVNTCTGVLIRRTDPVVIAWVAVRANYQEKKTFKN